MPGLSTTVPLALRSYGEAGKHENRQSKTVNRKLPEANLSVAMLCE